MAMHAELVTVAAKWLKRRCVIVLTERGSVEIPDAIGWTGQGQSIVVECKVSLRDFEADWDKPFRHGSLGMGQTRWFLSPLGVLSDRRYPNFYPWGFLAWDGQRCHVRQKANVIDANLNAERRLLLNELRAFHAQGLTYKKGKERWTLPPQTITAPPPDPAQETP